MKNEFKTPALEKLYYMLLRQYPIPDSKKNELKRRLADISLPDRHPAYEHFYHELHIHDCGTVTIVWNIEKIIKSNPKDTALEIHNVQELTSLIDFSDHNIKEMMSGLLSKGKMKHRADFITLAVFPGFPKFTIIDGNHRVLENLVNPSFEFNCYMLGDETILDFLEPNSRKFAEFIYYLPELVSK